MYYSFLCFLDWIQIYLISWIILETNWTWKSRFLIQFLPSEFKFVIGIMQGRENFDVFYCDWSRLQRLFGDVRAKVAAGGFVIQYNIEKLPLVVKKLADLTKHLVSDHRSELVSNNLSLASHIRLSRNTIRLFSGFSNFIAELLTCANYANPRFCIFDDYEFHAETSIW